MNVDNNLHMTNVSWQTEFIRKKFSEQIKRVGAFVIDCNEPNWDSYNAEEVSVKTLKFAANVLLELCGWCMDNLGFFNNRSFEIFTCPSCNGEVHVEFNYDNNFEIDIYAKHGEPIHCYFHPQYRIRLDGTRTIADRDFPLVFSKDDLEIVCDLKDLRGFLNEGFYDHKWKFEEDYFPKETRMKDAGLADQQKEAVA